MEQASRVVICKSVFFFYFFTPPAHLKGRIEE